MTVLNVEIADSKEIKIADLNSSNYSYPTFAAAAAKQFVLNFFAISFLITVVFKQRNKQTSLMSILVGIIS